MRKVRAGVVRVWGCGVNAVCVCVRVCQYGQCEGWWANAEVVNVPCVNEAGGSVPQASMLDRRAKMRFRHFARVFSPRCVFAEPAAVTACRQITRHADAQMPMFLPRTRR